MEANWERAFRPVECHSIGCQLGYRKLQSPISQLNQTSLSPGRQAFILAIQLRNRVRPAPLCLPYVFWASETAVGALLLGSIESEILIAGAVFCPGRGVAAIPGVASINRLRARGRK